ncbi:MAG: hypothetical protein ACKOA8_02785 [Deltaproteobacteria bacterium]
MRQKLHCLFVIFFSLFASLTQAESSLWKQPLRTEEDQVKFLLHMEKEIPGLFEGMTDFDTDLFQTLIWQQKFVDEVASQPENAAWAHKDPQLKKYKIRLIQKDTSNNSNVTLDPQSLNALRADIEAGLAQASPKAGQNLRQAIRKRLLELGNQESGKLFDGAANDFREFIPQSEHKTYLPLSPQAKLDYLTQTILPNLTSNQDAFKTRLEQLNRIMARDEKIRQLASAAVALGHEDEVMDAETLKKQLSSMDLATQFGTPDRVRLGLEKMLDSQESIESALSMAERKVKFNLAKGTLSEHTRQFKDFAEKPPQVVQEITVTEVPATHGVMRGCVGGDCASKNLVGYSNLPESRIFFVDTGKGVPAGYGEYAFVKSGSDLETHSQYFPVFNGKTLSGQVVDLVMRGLDQVKDQKGIQSSLVLRPDQLQYNSNYDVIREAFSEVMGAGEVPIHFNDAEVRRLAQPYVAVDNYHSPDKIRTALPYAPKPLAQGQSIEVTVEDSHLPALDLNQTIDKGSALRVALELEAATEKPQYTEIQLKNLDKIQEHVDYDHNARLQLRDSFLRAAHIPKEKFEETLKVLSNPEHLPVDAFLKKASEWLKGMGYEMDPNFKKTRIEPYLLGLYRAPDAFESRYKDKIVAGTLWLLQKGKHKEEVSRALASHPDLFKGNVRLGNILLELAKFESTKLYYPSWEIAETLGRGGYNGEGRPELIETLVSKLGSDQDPYHRKAAAGMLIKLNSRVQQAKTALEEMQRKHPEDKELAVLLHEAVQPKTLPSHQVHRLSPCEAKLGSL